MSMVALTGLPGAGKSYEAVANQIIPALKAGRIVYTNMKVDRDALIKMCGGGDICFLPEGVKAAELVLFVPPGAVLVLDEVWRYWPAGMTAKNIPEGEKEFFAMHRHKVGEDGNSQEIVLVTQDLSQIAAFLRELVEQTFRMTKLTVIGSKNKYRIDIYEGAVSGQRPPVSKRIREIFCSYRPEIYACYQSHTLSMTGKAGSEEKADQRGSLLKGWTLKASVAALVLLPFAIWGFVHALHGIGGGRSAAPPASERSEAGGGASKARTGQVGPAITPQPQWSTSWRLSGRIRYGLVDYFVVDGDNGARRIERHQCKVDAAGNTVCTVDGALVSYWTGPKAGFVESALGHTADGKAVSAN